MAPFTSSTHGEEHPDILDLPESILDLMGDLFNFNTFATVCQFPR